MNAAARRPASALVLCACCALLSSAARAQPAGAQPATVRLDVPDCLGVSGADVRRLVALELAPRLHVVDGGEGSGSAAILGKVTCDPDGVRIEVEDPQRAAPLQLELDLGAAPEPARARLLALSIAELIATSRLERAPEATPPAAGSEPVPAPAERAWKLWIAPGVSRIGAPALTLFGIETGGSRALGPGAVLVDLQARWGGADTLAAEVAVQAYSVSLALSPRLSFGDFELSVGPGVRLGYVRLSGETERAGLVGDAVAGAWFGPLAGASVQVRIAPWGAVRAAFELGYVMKPVRGLDDQSRRLLALDGVWASASLGAAVLLP